MPLRSTFKVLYCSDNGTNKPSYYLFTAQLKKIPQNFFDDLDFSIMRKRAFFVKNLKIPFLILSVFMRK